jgi:plasmid maintenance system antidote protein VapI
MCDNNHMGENEPERETLSNVLRRAIRESGVPYLRLARATNVERASIQRFVDDRTSLRLDKADKLATYFGLELRRGQRKGT